MPPQVAEFEETLLATVVVTEGVDNDELKTVMLTVSFWSFISLLNKK